MPEEQSYLSILRLEFHIIPKGLNNNNRGCQPTENTNIFKTLKEFNRLRITYYYRLEPKEQSNSLKQDDTIPGIALRCGIIFKP